MTGRDVESELESALDGMYAYDLRELIMGMSDEFKSELLGKIENRNVGKNVDNVGECGYVIDKMVWYGMG